METKTNAGEARPRTRISMKRMLLGFGVLLAFGVAAVGYCVLADLLGGRPVPEAVKRVEAEKQRIKLAAAAASERSPAALEKESGSRRAVDPCRFENPSAESSRRARRNEQAICRADHKTELA